VKRNQRRDLEVPSVSTGADIPTGGTTQRQD